MGAGRGTGSSHPREGAGTFSGNRLHLGIRGSVGVGVLGGDAPVVRRAYCAHTAPHSGPELCALLTLCPAVLRGAMRRAAVCEVCGVYIQSNQSEAQRQDHLEGKQYLGWKVGTVLLVLLVLWRGGPLDCTAGARLLRMCPECSLNVVC